MRQQCARALRPNANANRNRMLFLVSAGSIVWQHRGLDGIGHMVGSNSVVSGATTITAATTPRAKCLGRSDVWPGNRTCLYEDVWLLSDGTFTTGGGRLAGDDDTRQPLFLHNRWVYGNNGHLWEPPSSRESAKQRWLQFHWSIERKPVEAKGLLLPPHPPSETTVSTIGERPAPSCIAFLEWFHHNPAHNLLDNMYPSFFSLLAFRPDVAANGTWQWVTRRPVDNAWPLELLEAFSGHPVISVADLAASGTGAPIAVPCLVSGVGGRGIGIVDPAGRVVIGNLPGGSTVDPIQAFRDRIYRRYGKPIPEPIASIDINVGNRHFITLIESKRELRGAADIAVEAGAKLGMPVRTIRWEDLTFPEQLDVCSSTAILVVGVGTARINSFLLPEGAIEVQTCTHPSGSWAVPHGRYCFDAHIGTVASHVQVVHDATGYPQDDAKSKRAAPGLGDAIERAASLIPIALPVDRSSNLPPEVRLGHVAATNAVPELFWASSGWCHVVPTPQDCPAPYHGCPVTNDRNTISHAGSHGEYGKCLPLDVMKRAERALRTAHFL